MAIQTSEQSKTDSPNEKIIEEAKARFKLAEEAESKNRKEILDDLKFASGDQWDAEIKASRAAERRPCLTVNRISQHIKQVTNDQRQNRPSIKVHPVDDNADIETAKIYSGLIRHIEYNSNASVAYDTAFDSTVRGGRGFFRVITDYVSPLSFDQEILIKRIRNSLSVLFDPHSKELDGSDANYAFVIDRISKDEFETKYPNSELCSSQGWDIAQGNSSEWVSADSIQIVEYFYKQFEEKTIALLQGGEVVEANQIPDGAVVVGKRKAQVPVIKWCKINGCEILEETDWPGSFIPIIPVYGEELDIDGELIIKGIVRDAKDPQRMLNVWKSAETEAIGLAPKAPFIAAEGQLEGYEHIWETANTKSHSYLPYIPIALNGTVVPPPQRQAFEPAVQAITQAGMLAGEDIKATTGIYDAALGAKSNETSGIAIQRRNNQAQTSNFHFVDNLTTSIRHLGRILIDLIPKIYDTARAARILGEDGTPEIIKINQEFEHKGKPVTYDLSAGKYDATVDVGPSFASKRQEAAASMIEVTKAIPQIMQVAGDLLVKNMDWPGAQDLAERLKKIIPPELIDDPKEKGKDIPPQVQAQMQQMSQMVEQLTGKLNELQGEKEQKLIEIESKERIEFKKLEVQLEIERAKLDAKDSLQLLTAEIDQINQRMGLLSINQPIEKEEAPTFEPEMDGGMSAAPMMDHSTGGDMTPGLPMEEENHDDPSNF